MNDIVFYFCVEENGMYFVMMSGFLIGYLIVIDCVVVFVLGEFVY